MKHLNQRAQTTLLISRQPMLSSIAPLHARTHTHAYTHTNAYKHTNAHTHTHTHTHKLMFPQTQCLLTTTSAYTHVREAVAALLGCVDGICLVPHTHHQQPPPKPKREPTRKWSPSCEAKARRKKRVAGDTRNGQKNDGMEKRQRRGDIRVVGVQMQVSTNVMMQISKRCYG